MLYIAEKKTLDSAPTQSPSLPRAQVKVEEDEVDRLLSTRDGLVHRKKDSQLYENKQLPFIYIFF